MTKNWCFSPVFPCAMILSLALGAFVPSAASQAAEKATAAKSQETSNKGYSVEINSTEDQRAKSAPSAAYAAPATTAVPNTDVQLSDSNWRTPAVGIDADKDTYTDDDGSGKGSQALSVRMTFLPGVAPTPVPSPEHESAQKLGHEALMKSLEAKTTPKPGKTKEDQAACAAVDTYKKQQLDAIQSDRQTLSALQEAIRSLGVGNQLNMMAGSNSVLSNAPNKTTSSMSTPVPSTVR